MLKTVLHAKHCALGATLAPFAGWEMPLWYKAGAIKEHLAVVRAAGVFDTSHMDVLSVSGAGARAFLNCAFTKDIADLAVGRCGYGAFLDAEGDCIDDAIVYPLEADRFGVVVNAGMAETVAAHLAKLPGAESLAIAPAAPRLAKIDIQGPASVKLVANLLGDAAGALFEKFPYFSFKGDFDLSRSAVRLADGTPVLLSRTGYTGEVGFELFLPLDKAETVWDRLLADGGAAGVLPCGLAARDSLRTGAVLPLSHQDIGHWQFINHPWPFALPLDAAGGFTKPFFGRDALRPATEPHTLPFVGFDPRRVEPEGAKVLVAGEEAGSVTTIVSDMAIGRIEGAVRSLASPGVPEGWTPRGLACGFVRVKEKLPAGTQVTLRDARRAITVEIAADIRPARTARQKLGSFL